jgi:hypothetical protein
MTQIDYTEAGSSLNALKFYYGTDATSTFGSSSTSLSNGYNFSDPISMNAVRGRFDYSLSDDGVILYPNKNSYSYIHQNTIFHTINRFKNYYDDDINTNICLYIGLNGSYAIPMANLTVGQGFVSMLCADIKGIQEEFPIKVNNYVDGLTDKLTFSVYRNTEMGITNIYSRTFNYSTVHTDDAGYKSVVPKFFYTGDFNGDGKMEVMEVTVNNPLGRNDWPTRCIIYDLEN